MCVCERERQTDTERDRERESCTCPCLTALITAYVCTLCTFIYDYFSPIRYEAQATGPVATFMPDRKFFFYPS